MMTLVKLALLLLFHEIFGTLRWLRRLVLYGAVIISLFYASCSISLIAVCAPRRGLNASQMSLTKICQTGGTTVGLVQGIGNIISDFYLLVVPIPAVLGLHMPTRKKFGILGIFMTGLL